MSDVPIRLSRKFRKTLLDLNKAKGTGKKLGLLFGGLKHLGLEVASHRHTLTP